MELYIGYSPEICRFCKYLLSFVANFAKMIAENLTVQKHLIDILDNLCPKNESLADLLADLLQVSKDSAYRRIRCEKIIDLNELVLISKHFRISLDSMLGLTSNSVVFDYDSIKHTADYKRYLQSIIDDLNLIAKHDNVKLIYASQDIPLYHYFYSEPLARFKFFYWLRSIVNAEEFQNQVFREAEIDDELIHLGKELYNVYTRVPSEEIWTELTPASLFKQVEFCWSSGLFFDKDQALIVCDEIKQTFNRIEQQARSGIKIDVSGQPAGFGKNYKLYLSEIEIGNNCILTQVGEHQSVYLTFNTFNKIVTANNIFSEEVCKWLNNLTSKSTPISEVSEKHRYQFFKKLNKGLEEVRKRIELDD